MEVRAEQKAASSLAPPDTTWGQKPLQAGDTAAVAGSGRTGQCSVQSGAAPAPSELFFCGEEVVSLLFRARQGREGDEAAGTTRSTVKDPP